MKDGKFEIGDRIVCVDNESISIEMIKGEKYKFLCYLSLRAPDYYLYVSDKGGKILGPYKSNRFKLAEPIFEHEYFSALNEKDAEKYIGKIMEFADVVRLKENNWAKGVLWPFTENYLGNYLFNESNGGAYQFMRTCPETFKKKKVKKTVERWVNVYQNGAEKTYRYFEDAMADRDDIGCIACLHLTKEYEVEE